MTTTTLRPNATASSASISITGAASAHAATSDNVDTSYLRGTASAAIATLEAATFTLPAGALVKQVRCRMRGRSDEVTAGFTYSTTLTLAGGFELARIDQGATAGAWVDSVSAWSVLAPAGGWNQSHIDALQIITRPRHDGTPGTSTDISEAYADVIHVAIPVTTVTAVTPDPYTASNIVPIAWTNTLDADGGVQTRYQIRVFTAAQYGIGGFDPATSPATQDTGEVVSAALTRNTVVLANSTTFRAYVRVAQTVNGVSHWSAYAFDQFAISVTTSDISSVTTVAVNASARIDITVNRNTATAAWNFVEVKRSINAGVTWSPVRGATYVNSTGNANTFTVSDHETGNGQATIYRARATRILSSLPITGAFVQSTPAVSWTSESAWLKSPANPSKNSPVLVTGPVESSTGVDRGVFNVLGRAAPVVVSDVRQLTVGRITFQTESDAAIATLRGLLADSELLFHAPANWSVSAMYISIGDVGRERGPMEGFAVTRWPSSYVEIATPRDPLASAP